MKRIFTYLFFLSLSVGLFVAVYWFRWLSPFLRPGQEVTFIAPPPVVPDRPIVRDAPDIEARVSDRNPPIAIEAVATGLDTPWDIVFTSPTRLLVTERPGQIRVIENGVLEKQPIHVFSEVVEKGEDGLMSLALDPNYPQNHFLYAAIAYADGQRLWLKVMRFVDAGDTLADSFMVIDRIPAAQYHSGCRIAFG
ncbi:MAG: PQQ-dependent sugar dehydrogenase, partial [Candidatus Moraniibacteriota bacterium]